MKLARSAGRRAAERVGTSHRVEVVSAEESLESNKSAQAK